MPSVKDPKSSFTVLILLLDDIKIVYDVCLAGAEGFEPAAFGFGDQRSNQLSYAPRFSA